MYELSVRTHFSAAHHLEGYNGKCAEQHGHNWQVEVFITGEQLQGTGILVDFHQLKEMVKEVLGSLDHSDLNTLEAFSSRNPTSENIARFIYDSISAKIGSTGCSVSRVVVGETAETSASYSSSK